MKANFERKIAKGFAENNLSFGSNTSSLVSINGRPSISLPNAFKLNGERYPNPALFISNNSSGDAGLTELTPSNGMGTSLGVIGGNPATVYISSILSSNPNKPIYSRSLNSYGLGIWNSIIINKITDAPDITNVSDPIELNGGVYFLAWFLEAKQENVRTIYSIINTKFDGSGSWTITKIGSFGGSNIVKPLVVGTLPAFSTNDLTNTNNDILLYCQATDSIGSNWTITKIDEYASIRKQTALLIPPNNDIAIYCLVYDRIYEDGDIKETLSIKYYTSSTSSINFNKAKTIIIIAPDNSNSDVNLIRAITTFSVTIVNGNVAISYYIRENYIREGSGYLLIYQYQPQPPLSLFSDPVVIKEYDINTKINAMSLADINNGPCIVISEFNDINFDSCFIFLRSGAESTFVEDTSFSANYSIN